MSAEFFLLPNVRGGMQASAREQARADSLYNTSMLRKLRSSHGPVPREVEDFILQRQTLDDEDTGLALWRLLMRLSSAFGVLIAAICAPIALLIVLYQLAQTLGIDHIETFTLAPLVEGLLNGPVNRMDMLGYLAAVSMLFTFGARNKFKLRILAILSNILFICYAFSLNLTPVLILHGCLLPINIRHLIVAVGESFHDRAQKRYRIENARMR